MKNNAFELLISKFFNTKKQLDDNIYNRETINMLVWWNTIKTRTAIIFIVIVVLTIIFKGFDAFYNIILSIIAAGIFYIVFNIYPEQRRKVRVLRELQQHILALHGNRMWMVCQLLGSKDLFSITRRGLFGREDCMRLIKKVNTFQIMQSSVDERGQSVIHRQKSVLDLPVLFLNNIISDHVARKDINQSLTLGDMYECYAMKNHEIIKSILSINGIESFDFLYESLINYLAVNQSILSKHSVYMMHGSEICYSLIQVADTVFYYAAVESASCISMSWVANNYKDSEVARFCSILSYNQLTDADTTN